MQVQVQEQMQQQVQVQVPEQQVPWGQTDCSRRQPSRRCRRLPRESQKLLKTQCLC